jgi:hypothetical protein
LDPEGPTGRTGHPVPISIVPATAHASRTVNALTRVLPRLICLPPFGIGCDSPLRTPRTVSLSLKLTRSAATASPTSGDRARLGSVGAPRTTNHAAAYALRNTAGKLSEFGRLVLRVGGCEQQRGHRLLVGRVRDCWLSINAGASGRCGRESSSSESERSRSDATTTNANRRGRRFETCGEA